MREKVSVEEEIDIRDLFKIIWTNKKIILVFTSILTILSIVYVEIKTPIYEAKALLEIGSYKTKVINNQGEVSILNKNLDDSNILSKKLSTIFIDLKKNDKNKEVLITRISSAKGLNTYIEISSEATSNTLAIKGLEEIISYTKGIHIEILKDVSDKNKFEVKNIDSLVSNIKNVKVTNINKKINLYNENIINLKEQAELVIKTLKNINKLDYSITALKLMEKRDISNEIIKSKTELYDLMEEKENLININLNKLLESKKLLETLSLPHNLKTTEIVGDILISDDPIKPNKKLIVVICSMLSFILSVFLVFFMEFIKGFKKRMN